MRLKGHWVVVLGGLVAASMPGCVTRDSYLRLQNQLDASQDALVQAKRYMAEVEQEQEKLKGDLADARRQLGSAKELEARKAELEELMGRLQKSYSGMAGPKNVVFEAHPEGLALTMTGEVLFPSGSAELSEEGKATLREVAELVKKEVHPLRVSGHTDADPIRKSGWRSNTELSVRRAVEVCEALAASGVPRERMEVAGYGEFHPRVQGSGEAEKRKNRRVEVILLGKR